MELSDEENERGRNNVDSGNEGGYRSDEAEEEPSGQNEDGEVGKGRRIDPSTSTKRVIRNPQPKLNLERIQGPKGIQDIENYFEGFEFRGNGHEKSDLDRVMKRLEHWAHRLFPKYRYEDFLEKMEVLGHKKNVQVYLKKYRLGMIQPDNIIIDDDDENTERVEQSVPEEAPIDEFDKLIAEQIEKQRQVTNNDSVSNNNARTGNLLGSASTAKPSEITDEVKARIEANRLLAMERKAARLRREEESKKRKLGELQVDSQVFDTIEDFNNAEVFGEKRHEETNKDSEATRNKKEEERKEDNENMRKEKSQRVLKDDAVTLNEIDEHFESAAESEKIRLPAGVPITGGEKENLMVEKDVDKTENINEKHATEQENAISAINANEDSGRGNNNENAQGPLEGEMTIDEMDEYIMSSGESKKICPSADVPFTGGEKENQAVHENVTEVPVYEMEESTLNKTDNRKFYGKSKEADKTLTHEELLMEIDGAMEEIITRSTRRSA